MTAVSFRDAVRHHMRYSVGKEWPSATPRDRFMAVALAARQPMLDLLFETEARYTRADAKRLYYLSIEFLVGRTLGSALRNLAMLIPWRETFAELNVDLGELEHAEPDPALGNGGLGRLAACFLDSLATQGMPGYGYGINYEFGLFRQAIDNGHQRERPDHWWGERNPWLIERPDEACVVPVYGRIEHGTDLDGHYNPMWLDWKVLIGIPSDMPVVGYGGKTVNVLRLYSARASDEFDIDIFNTGDYLRAVEQKIASETVSKILYPSDSASAGRELRLVQEYFLVACAVRDIMRRYLARDGRITALPAKVAIQLNDTHPALAVAELMRCCIDEHSVPWETAWDITRNTLGYTNHTLLPEALESWPVPLLERVLPRHLQIIYEINHRFLDQIRVTWPGDDERVRRVSVIDESEPKRVRMGHLAVIGSHAVNGVAALHTRLVTEQLFPDFHALWPERFSNKTNGITPRRWLLHANPALADLITRLIGDAWITDLDQLRNLEAFVDDEDVWHEFMAIKLANKRRLADVVLRSTRVTLDPDALFDIQAKRIHEYKRQLLNVLHIIDQYLGVVEDGRTMIAPKAYIFAGKAAPGYAIAKLIIKLINSVAAVVNRDPRTHGEMKVVFVPDYRVSLAERIIPAADLSEQISTAGKEASGTGNMKFALNGALTIGTLDGANIEIRDEVGADNMYIFGLTAEEVQRARDQHQYDPRTYIDGDDRLRRVMDSLAGDRFCEDEPGLFRPLYESIAERGDEYFHLADFDSYAEAHERAARDFVIPEVWARKAMLNVARIGRFSSDRTIRDYAKEIWDLTPID